MRSRFLSFISLLATVATLGLLGAQKESEVKTDDDFHIEGVGLWQCQCPSHGCPCQTNGSPKHGTCYAADFAHISQGQFGRTLLDGLNVALVGNLVDTKQERLFGTLYIDAQATREQREGLRRMVEYLNSQNVDAPGDQPIPIKEVRAVPFQFSESDNKTVYSVTIPGILEEKATLPRDSDGKPSHSMAAMDMWSNIVHNADSPRFSYHDPKVEKAWDYSSRYANVKYFDLSKEMYARRRMLILDGDMSGKWTAKQEELIRQLGLPKN